MHRTNGHEQREKSDVTRLLRELKSPACANAWDRNSHTRDGCRVMPGKGLLAAAPRGDGASDRSLLPIISSRPLCPKMVGPVRPFPSRSAGWNTGAPNTREPSIDGVTMKGGRWYTLTSIPRSSTTEVWSTALPSIATEAGEKLKFICITGWMNRTPPKIRAASWWNFVMPWSLNHGSLCFMDGSNRASLCICPWQFCACEFGWRLCLRG